MIISHTDRYVRVDLELGMSADEIKNAIRTLSLDTDRMDKNCLWKFHNGTFSLAYDELISIKELVQNKYLCDKGFERIALVAVSGFQMGIIDLFVHILSDLPFEVRSFPTVNSAEPWLSSNGSGKSIDTARSATSRRLSPPGAL